MMLPKAVPLLNNAIFVATRLAPHKMEIAETLSHP